MNHRIRTLAAEGVLIVVSILVAFAIDAWWVERQDRDEERRILQSLKAEFRHNIKRIPIFIELHTRAADDGDGLLAALYDAGPGGSIRSRPVHVMRASSHNSTDPQRGALDAILQSGEMRYISDPQIRERLAGWPQWVADATENEDLLRNQWDPLLRVALADVATLYPVDDECWEDDTSEACGTDEVVIPYDSKVIGLLMPAIGFAREAARELGILLEEAEAIVSLLDQQLENLGSE